MRRCTPASSSNPSWSVTMSRDGPSAVVGVDSDANLRSHTDMRARGVARLVSVRGGRASVSSGVRRRFVPSRLRVRGGRRPSRRDREARRARARLRVASKTEAERLVADGGCPSRLAGPRGGGGARTRAGRAARPAAAVDARGRWGCAGVSGVCRARNRGGTLGEQTMTEVLPCAADQDAGDDDGRTRRGSRSRARTTRETRRRR